MPGFPGPILDDFVAETEGVAKWNPELSSKMGTAKDLTRRDLPRLNLLKDVTPVQSRAIRRSS
jgi:hypothetical protein